MFQQPGTISFNLPEWLQEFSQTYQASTDLCRRMQFVISASLKNLEMGSGGPFAAAVFERENGNLVALGVNLVTSQGMSMLHAEMVALAIAQRKFGQYDLGDEGLPELELVSSAEPCSMCLGAIPWSGVKHVAVSARDQDVRDIGFDEGAKPEDWKKALEQRGISVSADVERESACEVLQRSASELTFRKY